MRVYILTEGGKDIGFGHIVRCSAIYDAFLEVGIEPLFVVNGDESVLDLLNSRDYVLFDWIKERQKVFDIIQYADIGVIDSYLAPFNFYERFEKSVKLPLYIDDNKRFEYPRGIVVNGSIYAKEMKYPMKKGLRYLLGPEYVLLRKEFWDIPERNVRRDVEKLLITFGGDDMRGLTPRVLTLLDKRFPNILKMVVVGKGFKNREEIANYKGNKVSLVWYPDGEKMKELMMDADIAVSAGGQTLYELARIGVPPIVVGVAKNQKNNIEGWKKKGFIQYAGWWDKEEVIENVASFVESLMPYEVRKEIGELGREIVDGKGPKRVVDTLLSTS